MEENTTSEWKLLIAPQVSNTMDVRKEKRDRNVFPGSNIREIISFLNVGCFSDSVLKEGSANLLWVGELSAR